MRSILVVFLAGRFRVGLIIIVIIFFLWVGVGIESGWVQRVFLKKLHEYAKKLLSFLNFLNITNRDFQFILIVYYHTSSVKFLLCKRTTDLLNLLE